MSSLKKWILCLTAGLIVAALGFLLAFALGALYMEFAFKMGGN